MSPSQPAPAAPARPSTKQHLVLDVNGEIHEILAPVHHTLLEVLREDLDLTGTKHGCELGECGACAVLVDGEPILSCLTLPIECQAPDHAIITVEGLGSGSEPHPVQVAFAELGASQCGYCSPGFVVTAKALLDADPRPSRERIVEALSGNICRCTGYVKIFEAVELAAARLRGEQPPLPDGIFGYVVQADPQTAPPSQSGLMAHVADAARGVVERVKEVLP